jgi:hypothetical protein
MPIDLKGLRESSLETNRAKIATTLGRSMPASARAMALMRRRAGHEVPLPAYRLNGGRNLVGDGDVSYGEDTRVSGADCPGAPGFNHVLSAVTTDAARCAFSKCDIESWFLSLQR